MTVSINSVKVQFSGNGVTTVFNYPFKVLADADMAVYLTSSLGAISTLILNVDYTITGAGSTGGTVILTSAATAPTGSLLTLTRLGDLLQETDFTDGEAFSAESIEAALDKTFLVAQQQQEQIDRSIKLPVDSLNDVSALPSVRESTVLGFDATGELTLYDSTASSTVSYFNGVMASDYASLDAAVAAAGAADSDIVIDVAIPIVNSLTVPDTARLIILRAGSISIPTGKVLTIAADFECGRYEAFTGAGTVVFSNGSVDEVFPEWWGAIVDDAGVDCSLAINKALVTVMPVKLTKGTYYTANPITMDLDYYQLLGYGKAVTTIRYSGTGFAINAGIGFRAGGRFTYNTTMKDFIVLTTNTTTQAGGIKLNGCLYFNVENVGVAGSGNPTTSVPLLGYGFYLTDTTIIGHFSGCIGVRFIAGMFMETTIDVSGWTAAISIDGQSVFDNNMTGIIIGDADDPAASGIAVSIRDCTVQSNYNGGISVRTGTSTLIDNVYFEENGFFDVEIGQTSGVNPIGVSVKNSNMQSEDCSVSPYGTVGDNAYVAKVYVKSGNFASIRDNMMSISSATTPLVKILAAAVDTAVTGNRLNNGGTTASRVSNASSSSNFRDNYPEVIETVHVGTFTRVLDAASGSVAYTGVGFKPKSIEFTAFISTATPYSIGFCGNTAKQKCMTAYDDGSKITSDTSINMQRTAGNGQSAVVTSFDIDGFTLDWTLIGSPPSNAVIVNYRAIR